MINVDDSLKKLLNRPKQPWQVFRDQNQVAKGKIKELNEDQYPESWKKIYYKGYVRFKNQKLPPPKAIEKSLTKTLEQRISSREFSKSPLTIKQISTLLYYGSGIKKGKNPDQKRFYPSGGARYPLEIYLIPLNVTHLNMGVYHYYVKQHSLEFLWELKESNVAESIGPTWPLSSGCILFISSVFHRTNIKYGNKGYNLSLLEAGHLSQNMYLISTALGIECCAFGGFYEKEVNTLLGLSFDKESVITSLIIGSRSTRLTTRYRG